MGHVAREITIRAPPERVFQSLIEPTQRATWATTFEEQPLDGPLRVGARIPARRRASTSGSRYELVVTALEPSRKLAMDVHRNGRHSGSGAFELEATTDGTRVRNVGTFELPLLQRMMEPVVALALAREMESELNALKRHVEGR